MQYNIPFGQKYLAVISTHGYYTIHERVGDTEEYRPVIKGLTDEFGLIYYPITDDIYGEPETDSERDALAQMLATHITLTLRERYDLMIRYRMEWMKRLLGREVSESEVADPDTWYGLWKKAYLNDEVEYAWEMLNSDLPDTSLDEFPEDDFLAELGTNDE